MMPQRKRRYGREFGERTKERRWDAKNCQVCGELAGSYYVDHKKGAQVWRHATIVIGRGGKRLNGEAKYCELPIDKPASGRSGS